MPLSDDLLSVAKKRIASSTGITEADLRRSTSDLYFSLFHRICESVVEPIGSEPDNPAFIETYLTLYRVLEHAYAEKRCKEIKDHAFSKPILDFSRHFVAMKNKRNQADYDPLSKIARSSVENDVRQTESVLYEFAAVSQQERVRFAYFLAIRGRSAG